MRGNHALGLGVLLIGALGACTTVTDEFDESQQPLTTVSPPDQNYGEVVKDQFSEWVEFTVSPAEGVQTDAVSAVTELCNNFDIDPGPLALPQPVTRMCEPMPSPTTTSAECTEMLYVVRARFHPRATGHYDCLLKVTLASGLVHEIPLSGLGVLKRTGDNDGNDDSTYRECAVGPGGGACLAGVLLLLVTRRRRRVS